MNANDISGDEIVNIRTSAPTVTLVATYPTSKVLGRIVDIFV